MMTKRSKTPLRYKGYYEIDERYGDHAPEFMAVMAPNDHGGFSAQIYAKPVSYTLEFYPDDDYIVRKRPARKRQ